MTGIKQLTTQMTTLIGVVKSQDKAISELKISISDLANKQDGYAEKQNSIISLIESNSKINSVGMFEQIQKNKSNIQKCDVRDQVIKGQSRLIGFLVGGSLTGFASFIYNYLK